MIWNRHRHRQWIIGTLLGFVIAFGLFGYGRLQASSHTQKVVADVATAQEFEQSASTSRMSLAFAAAPDLRAFAVDAKERPAEGGHFYGMLAASVCANAQIAENPRCAAFKPREANELYEAIRVKSLSQADPLIRARQS